MEPMPTERRWSEEGLSTVLMVDERAEEAPRAPVDQADVESLVRLVLADPDGLARNAVRSRRACPICHGYSFLDLHGVEHVVRSTEEEASLRERGRLHLLGSDELWLPLNGARGYSKDTVLEWIYRYARQARLVDGASEVHKMVFSRTLMSEGADFWHWN